MANAKNPNNALGDNEYAGFKAPKRADASTVLPGGNIVDRNRINKTHDHVSRDGNAVKPGGTSSGSGY